MTAGSADPERGLGRRRRALCFGGHCDPARARLAEFSPFWELVAGPINAGTFGPGEIDRTLGPEVRFKTSPDGMEQNRPPSEGMQHFGRIAIDGAAEVIAATLHELRGVRRHLLRVAVPK